ncbi:MAG: DUF3276 family protein [Flavobacteriales bacterium]|nr:DNA-binding protein [Flavobacteriales bacterium]HRE74700.1 DUF3276 family protein [Flavobacteriales bacterium]HRJ35755.1 DUF3276 family protein [Flavobacteriales bacterium]HRJ37997.1 DUF3276 family protein [Flavobacteriales bacterium]
MEEGYENNGNGRERDRDRDEIYSKAVRAGKRTYFFDVKTTRGSDLYITITESKKRFDKDGLKVNYEKHKIFLYKEDFEKFVEGLNETVSKISELRENGYSGGELVQDNQVSNTNFNYTTVEFEDLDK